MVRRGLFVVVPKSLRPEALSVNRFQVAGTLTKDAVISHRSALEYYGLAPYSEREVIYSAFRPLGVVEFKGLDYKGVKFPKSLIRIGEELHGVRFFNRSGLVTRVSSPERALVDIIDRLDLVGGWSEVKSLLSALTDLNIDDVVEYAKCLANATTAAKVGYYLAGQVDKLPIKDSHLKALSLMRPNQPHYLDRSRRREGRLVAEWNLMVHRGELAEEPLAF
jgi:predicted transcriptional regulator of viral defense system